MMDLKVAQVDLQRCRFKLADAKTEAGVREVEMTLYLRDELLAYAMDRRTRGLPLGASDHFFATATGKRRDPDRFRDRILARAVVRANATRAESGLAPLPPITPHAMSDAVRTYVPMREYGYMLTEHDPSKPWLVLGREHRSVNFEDSASFFEWGAPEWPEPQWSVELDPYELSPWLRSLGEAAGW